MRNWAGRAALLVVATTLVPVGGAGVAAAAPATTATPVRCAGQVQITSLAFAPATVAPGATSTATLRTRNCTAKTLTASTTL
jgi:hypothetical protein